jgi:hypothetical protein
MPASTSPSTVTRQQRLNVSRNVLRYRSFRHQTTLRHHIEALYQEAYTNARILEGFYTYLNDQSVDGTHLIEHSHIDEPRLGSVQHRTPRAIPTLRRACNPHRHLELPDYDPDGYSSDPETLSRGHRLTSRIAGNKRIWTPPGYIYNRDSSSVTAVFHLDTRIPKQPHQFIHQALEA